MRRNVVAVAALCVSLVGVGALAAQLLAVEPVPPRVLAGMDVGFRVEGLRGGRTPVGAVVVRINGEWVEAEIGRVRPDVVPQ